MSTENTIAANTISSFAKAVQKAYDRKSNDYLPVLAKLRNCAGLNPSDNVEAWSIVIDSISHTVNKHNNDDSDDKWHVSAPNDENGSAIMTKTERALIIAFSMYAIQSSPKNRKPHDDETEFGVALARYVNSNQNRANWMDGILDSLCNAHDLDSASYYLRQIASNVNIGFNYGDFVKNLITFQYDDNRRGVLMRWIRDYHMNLKI